ncbi:MAG: succinylarginine dihydrolase [Solimicrobium sp.]|jgi:succinylarginine dihydrolase|nr:succinylarginine dihydrolase [Solimicrobium sp.]
MKNAREYNFDGLVGPTHNYAGLSFGNVASFLSANKASNPKEAALQGLDKMRMLAQRGIAQAVLPPQDRPNFRLLRQLGFKGTEAQMIEAAARTAPILLACAYSAASMWTANAATVSPSADTADGRVHFTVANLNTKLHRSFECVQTERTLRAIFYNENYFSVHQALPSTPVFGDEGAANHTRFCSEYSAAGIELFVYGRSEWDAHIVSPKKFPARQSKEASNAVARLHGLDESRTIFVQQNPDVIDLGVFHNDVIAVGNGNLFFYHQEAFVNEKVVIEQCRTALQQVAAELRAIRVDSAQVSVADAVTSYLFNSQLLTKPDGKMMLLVPQECYQNRAVSAYLANLKSYDAIDELLSIDLRQSMCNGGGPACLRLRVELTEQQANAMHQGIIFTEDLYARLVQWVKRHYRDVLLPEDLADPILALEVQSALAELSEILDLPALYTDL